MPTTAQLTKLADTLDGELHHDDLMRRLYATDASVYRDLPLAVALPRSTADLQRLLRFATAHSTGLIPRAAGTSLAGQCVGPGIVVDTSRHFRRIISIDVEARTVTVEPGVIRDDLNQVLAPHGLWFSPNTSTSNRCMIGGMVGNNSCGSTSIAYGNTRDKVVSMTCVLSDGSEVVFSALSQNQFHAKRELPTLEGMLYEKVWQALSPPDVQARIIAEYPKPSVTRRNTGYALDELAAGLASFRSPDRQAPSAPVQHTAQPPAQPIRAQRSSKASPTQEGVADPRSNATFSMQRLLTGSEGTLAFTTSVTLQLDPLPPPHAAIVVPHFTSVRDCLRAVVPAMQHKLYACEMLDRIILDLTAKNAEQAENRALIHGEPEALLMLEVRAESAEELDELILQLAQDVSATGLPYHTLVLRGDDINSAMELRAAGLGLLGNLAGDAKAVACIEDTAVAVEDLAEYIDRFAALMIKYEQRPVYYAHAGAGEIHLRPILDLKKSADVVRFRQITDEVATLVKEFGGSMSGEHGDGIVRAGYIPQMIGQANYELCRELKYTFDPAGVFNPGKVVDAFAMDERLRYTPDREEPQIETLLDFSDTEGILRMAEKCNGAGVCRRSVDAGGTMCPSYKVTLDEKHGTRARANAMREILTHSEQPNRFDSQELKEVFDLCISCKACATQCPSSVDVATLKAEFEHQYMQVHGASLRSRLFAHNDALNSIGRLTRPLTNWTFANTATSGFMKRMLGVAPQRSLPQLSRQSLRSWCTDNLSRLQPATPISEVLLFVDEFTNQLDTPVGIHAIELLTRLGYGVQVVEHGESGRALISKGFLAEAKKAANHNVAALAPLVSETLPVIGIEPSAILTLRDEYLRLADDKPAAKQLAKHTFLIDEWLAHEVTAGRIHSGQFGDRPLNISLHGHCHQKTWSKVAYTAQVLNVPSGHRVSTIPSGCCGMAGSFGYEAEHYEVSMAIGEQVLFPAIRSAFAKTPATVVVAPGTSCRHQIKDGTGAEAMHPVTVLWGALK